MGNTWIRLAKHEITSGTASQLLGSWTGDYRRLKVIYNGISSGQGINGYMRFNNDSSSDTNYTIELQDTGGSNTAYGQRTMLAHDVGTATTNQYAVTEIENKSNQEKLVIGHVVNSEGTSAATGLKRRELVGKWIHTGGSITSVQIDNGGSGAFGVGSYLIVFGIGGETTSDEKTTLSDIPANTRYEETDTRKIYRWKQAPLEPVFHYKFSESSGDVINHGSVANADLTVGSLTRDQSTPSGIGNGMKTPNEDSGYAENTSRVNDYKFMHDGTAKWSITFWLKCYGVPDTSTTEHMLFGNVWTDDAGVGFGIRLAKNSDNSSSKARIQTMVARNAGGMPVNDQTADDMMPDTSNWHFYCITYDPTLSSNNLTISRDAETSGTGFSQDDTTNENWSTSNPTRKTTYMARPTTGGNAYDNGVEGTMAQVMIFKDVILTQANKESLYASGNGTTTIPDSKEWVERGTA